MASCALWCAIALGAAGGPEHDLLDPEQAFRLSAGMPDPRTIEVRYRVAEGYYLYKARLAFSTDNPAVRLGAPQLPAGEWHEDEFFGRSEIYRGEVTIRIPLDGQAAGRFTLIAVSQGCADVGVCYLPLTQRALLFPARPGGKQSQKP
ncbi:MAG TPA: protein-disulfide reductase DsbD N-terminal domain-containing protein [Burkholderiales bacterium]|nr:protein-disulfide reductase DsbD N-terminal domain-containing protein [Burkholderiales bacterium]